MTSKAPTRYLFMNIASKFEKCIGVTISEINKVSAFVVYTYLEGNAAYHYFHYASSRLKFRNLSQGLSTSI